MTDASTPPTENAQPSPLGEAEPTSLQVLFDRVNDKLIQGLPEAIDDEKEIMPIVDVLRKERVRFVAEQDRLGRAPAAPRKRKPTSVADAIAADLDLDV